MITFEQKGNFNSTEKFLTEMSRGNRLAALDSYAREGVAALASATPKSSGLTAESWRYEITEANGKTTIIWSNTHVEDGVQIAIILQYGHATGTGGYVQGEDYINPVMKPLFDKISNNVWKEVTSA